MNLIIPNFYIADEFEVHTACKKKMVDAVLDLRHEAFTEYEHDFYNTTPWIDYKHMPIKDGERPPKDFLDKAIKYIKSRYNIGDKVIIACQAGISRSPMVMLAFMIEYNYKLNKGKTHDEILDLLLINRPMTLIHPVLWDALNNWCISKNYGELPDYYSAMGKSHSLYDSGYWNGLYGLIDRYKLGETWVDVFASGKEK